MTKKIRKKLLQSGYMSVGELKKFIKKYKIPDDALILYQRIEDVYFEHYNWNESICTIKKPSEFKGFNDTYLTTWSPIKFKNDDNLYITAHY